MGSIFDDSPCFGTSTAGCIKCSEMHAEQTQYATVHVWTVDSWTGSGQSVVEALSTLRLRSGDFV